MVHLNSSYHRPPCESNSEARILEPGTNLPYVHWSDQQNVHLATMKKTAQTGMINGQMTENMFAKLSTVASVSALLLKWQYSGPSAALPRRARNNASGCSSMNSIMTAMETTWTM